MPLPSVQNVHAISLDLDDTLWPIMPVIDRADAAVLDWFRRHCPRVAQRYDVDGMRGLRDDVTRRYPHLGHDLGALRRLCLRTALLNCGYHPELASAAWEVYYAQRLNIELYEDADLLLTHASGRIPLATVSNGNADLQRIGLRHHFTACIHAHEIAARKPDAAIWQALLDKLNCPAEHVLHIGDHPLEDVQGARDMGLQAVWLNRHDQLWPLTTPAPPTIRRLDEIFPWLGLASNTATAQTDKNIGL